MSKVMFDEPRLNEMERFLTRLYHIGKDNKDVSINEGLVYRELCKDGLSVDEIKDNGEFVFYKDLFKKWLDRSRSNNSVKKGLTVFHNPNWPPFLQYISNDDYEYFMENANFIKLYIPIKYQNIFESVNALFDYICESKVRHLSKVANKMRTDNVIVRLDKPDIENALKIINFINENEVLKNNLNHTNPFIPTIKGIGFMYESGISYNQEMANLISQYINECIKKNTLPAISDFYRWFKNNNYSHEVNSIFAYAIGEKDSIEVKDDNLSEQEKYQLLIESIKATFLKYDLGQAICALNKLVNEGNYDYFTNGTGEVKYRNLLKENVTKEDAIRYVKALLNTDQIYNYDIVNFCREILKKNLLNKFCEACLVTCEKYDEKQLESALKRLIDNNDAMEFSRFSNNDAEKKQNYRDIVAQYDRKGIINLMKLFLSENNYNYAVEDIDELIIEYSNVLSTFGYNIGNEKGRSR